jgi:hypothetical protein
MPRPHLLLLTIATFFSFAIAPPSGATVITTPADLEPGDRYRLMFITAAQEHPMSKFITFYDDFVNSQASASSSSEVAAMNWSAVVATLEDGLDGANARSVRENTLTRTTDATDVSIYNLQGDRLANDYDDLYDALLLNPIQYDQSGQSLSAYAWTGFLPDGTTPAIGDGGPLGATVTGQATGYNAGYITGRSDHTTPSWADSNNREPGILTNHLYAMSDILVVSAETEVPEPGSLTLLSLGMAALCSLTRRTRR